MVELIVGGIGSGKTKRLINKVKIRAEESKGNVICIEKGEGLNADIPNNVRLINIDEYAIEGPNDYYGFISGLLAGNYDITDIYTDTTFKIVCGDQCSDNDMDILEAFILRVNSLGVKHECTIVFTISADESDLPQSLRGLVI